MLLFKFKTKKVILSFGQIKRRANWELQVRN